VGVPRHVLLALSQAQLADVDANRLWLHGSSPREFADHRSCIHGLEPRRRCDVGSWYGRLLCNHCLLLTSLVDLEKNQHYVASQIAAGRPVASISGGTTNVIQNVVGDTVAKGRATVDELKRRAAPATANDVPPSYETIAAGEEAKPVGAM
jgi:hypothetical protein